MITIQNDNIRILYELWKEGLISDYYLSTVADICLLQAADKLGIADGHGFVKQVRKAAEDGKI